MKMRFLNALNGMLGSNLKAVGKASFVSIGIVLLLLLSASCALAWPVTDLKITPENPCVNDGTISISGKVGPGDYVTITTTYVKEVPVSNGKYVYDAGIVPIPEGATCSVTAEGAKDLNIATSLLGIPVSHTWSGSKGKVVVTMPSIAQGKYELVISGQAAETGPVTNCDDATGTDTAKTVILTFVATMDVKADKEGYFEQVCCTERPAGEYTLKVGDKTKVITLRDCSNEKNDVTNDVNNDVANDATNENTVANGGGSGTGEAMVVTPESQSSSVGNASIMQTTPETNSEDITTEQTVADVTEQPESTAETNSFIAYVSSILEWLGFK